MLDLLLKFLETLFRPKQFCPYNCKKQCNLPKPNKITQLNEDKKLENLNCCNQCSDSALDAYFQKYSNFLDELNYPACNNCKMSWLEFQKTGKMGCAECYKHFYKLIKPIVLRVQDNNYKHCGKKTIKNRLEEAIKQENYELAAILKKMI